MYRELDLNGQSNRELFEDLRPHLLSRLHQLEAESDQNDDAAAYERYWKFGQLVKHLARRSGVDEDPEFDKF